IPYIMVDRLIVPLALTGSSVQRHDAVPEEVSPLSKSAIEIICRRTGGKEHPSPFFIHRESAPRIGAAVDFSFHPLPCIVTIFTLPRNGVKYPFEFSGNRVVRPHIAGRR